MKRNQIVLLFGLPASGKYTVAQKIQEKCGGVLLNNHYFYDIILCDNKELKYVKI